jgi:hypothetical protein
LRSYSPGGLLNALAYGARSKPLTPSKQSLRLGLQGSLIPFAPLAFVPQRQTVPSYPPSPSVFLSISTDFTPTPTVPVAPKSFNSGSIVPLSRVKPGALKDNFPNSLRNALRPINPDNACILCITAAAGTELADAYSPSELLLGKRGLQPEGLHPSRGVAASDFRPLRTIPGCCHP